MQFFIRKVADQQVRCVVYLNGRANGSRMANAIRLSLDAVPIMGCRYVEGWWRPYWKRVDRIDYSETYRTIETENVESEISRFLIEQVNPFKGPQVLVRMIRSATDTLCINMNHMVGDATGLKEYVYLLASIYRNLMENPKYEVQPNVRGCRGFGQVGRQIRLPDKIRILLRPSGRPFTSPNWRFPLSRGTGKPKILIHRFPGDRFNAIREYGKKHQATLNDVVLTAYYRALSETIHPDPELPLRVAVTIDLRRYIPSGQAGAVCNLSSFVFSGIGPGAGAHFDETLRKVRDDMESRKNDFPGLRSVPWIFVLFKLLPYSELKKKVLQRLEPPKETVHSQSGGMPPSLTNMGMMDSEKLVFGDVGVRDAYLAGAVNYPPGFQMGFSSFEESLTCSICFCDTEENTRVVERFFDWFEKELPR
jgi:NRPS condensation-like uncharacterized protein